MLFFYIYYWKYIFSWCHMRYRITYFFPLALFALHQQLFLRSWWKCQCRSSALHISWRTPDPLQRSSSSSCSADSPDEGAWLRKSKLQKPDTTFVTCINTRNISCNTFQCTASGLTKLNMSVMFLETCFMCLFPIFELKLMWGGNGDGIIKE